MSVEEIRKGIALLRDGREDDHAVYKAHHNPIDLVFWGRCASVPAEEREARGADEETKGDKIEAEFGLVNTLVESSGIFGGAVG